MNIYGREKKKKESKNVYTNKHHDLEERERERERAKKRNKQLKESFVSTFYRQHDSIETRKKRKRNRREK